MVSRSLSWVHYFLCLISDLIVNSLQSVSILSGVDRLKRSGPRKSLSLTDGETGGCNCLEVTKVSSIAHWLTHKHYLIIAERIHFIINA